MPMKPFLFLAALSLCAFLSGCGQSPVVSGTLLSGTVWATENSGYSPPKGTRVDVYDTFIVLHNADGTRAVAALNQVRDLKLQ